MKLSFALYLSRPQHIQTDARHNCREPSGDVFDRTMVRAAQPQPGLLNGIIGLAQGAEHPERHLPETVSVLLEPLCKPVLIAHVILTSGLFRPSVDEQKLLFVTGHGQSNWVCRRNVRPIERVNIDA
jgi:hypothetical protein